ncbi:MAG: hypothetical protein KY462_06910 [Actinobacteria bacterium]|nr:hypothetical protein [Actinomycetota bacterium]
MPRPRDAQDRNHRVVAIAVGSGVLALVAVVAVVVAAVTTGPRPEEDVARDFVEAALRGQEEASYTLVTHAYRAVVTRRDHAVLVAELHRLAGDDVTVEVLGSQRTAGSEPAQSLVGYTAQTAAGTAEGVITLLRLGDRWRVAEASYRFVDAPRAERERLGAVIRRLGEQVAERAGQLRGN